MPLRHEASVGRPDGRLVLPGRDGFILSVNFDDVKMGGWVKNYRIPEKITQKKAKNPAGELISDPIVFPYFEEKGTAFCYKCRFDWEDPDHKKGRGKTFRSYYIDGNGVVKTGFPRNGYYPVFRANEVSELHPKTTIIFVEGEKKVVCDLAADTERLGFFFTCVLSEGKTNFDFIRKFTDVIIIPDNDDAGRKKAIALKAYIPHAKIIEPPPELPESGDIADLEGWDGESLMGYIETAGEVEVDNSAEKRVAKTLEHIDEYSLGF